MAQTPIFESFYEDRTRALDLDACVNLYPEHRDGPKGPELGALFSTPGITAPLAIVGVGPVRALYVAKDGLLYAVSGSGFYSINSAWAITLLGSLTTSTGPCKIIDSPTQLLVVDGVAGWVWNLNALTWTKVIPNATTDLVNPSIAVYQDGFGLVNVIGSNEVGQSNYNDLSAFASLPGPTANTYFVQGNPQPIVTMFDLKREVWCFKQKAIEVLINQGSAGFAFTQLQGVYINTGCVAPESVARLGESCAWLGSDDRGAGQVYISVGYAAKPITPPALAERFQGFGTIADAIAYSYRSQSHEFYVITFPAANQTFAFDLATGKWHRRGYFTAGAWQRERANCYAFFNRKNIVGDYQNGNLYSLDENTYTDNGQPHKWARSWRALPPSVAQGKPMSFDSLQILMETGITVPPGSNPQMMLRVSYDGGYTWNGPFDVPMGKTGKTTWRAIANRLGSTSIETGLDPVFEISGIEPIFMQIVSAELEYGP